MNSETKSVLPIYAALIMIWALTPLAIVWSVSEMPRLWSLVLRFFLALPLVLIIVAVLRVKLPLSSRALHSYLAGSFSLIVSQTFTYLATSGHDLILSYRLDTYVGDLLWHRT